MDKVVKSEGISPMLRGADAEFVRASVSQRVMQMTEAEATDQIRKIINRTLAELGQHPAGSRPEQQARYLEAMSKMILSDIKCYFPNITIREVANAVNRGIRRQYGEYFGFNSISVHFFMENYLNGEDRTAALARQERFRVSKEPDEVPPVEKQRELILYGFRNCYEIYLSTGRVTDFGNMNYDLLDRIGLMNFSNREKWDMYHQAEKEIRKEDESMAVTAKQLNQVINNYACEKEVIISRSKNIALKRFFDAKPDLPVVLKKLNDILPEIIPED